VKPRVSPPFLGLVPGLVSAFLAGLVCVGGVAPSACVPSGSAPPYDAGASATGTSGFKPSLNVMTQPFEDSFDRPDASEGEWAPFTPPSATASAAAPRKGADAATALLLDAAADGAAGDDAGGGGGDGGALALGAKADAGPAVPTNLGPNWVQAKTSAWRVENGKLCGQGAKNHPVWLNKTLPVNARIEFDAVTYSDDGDLKCEVWGDGQGYARGTSYTDATSYLAILGGWKNTLHVLARLNEHGEDRKVLPVDPTSDDARQRPVVKGQVYRFKIERTDGKTVRFSVDGLEYHKWTDASPLAGQGHDHFGFNEWEARVCFDNVKVTPLP
jgi:hypothetical protein